MKACNKSFNRWKLAIKASNIYKLHSEKLILNLVKFNVFFFFYLTTVRASTPLRPSFRSGQIGFLVQKVVQCSETNLKPILRFLVFEIWSILYSKFLENLLKCYHKWPNYSVLLRFCSRIFQNTFQKILRKMKKSFAKRNIEKKNLTFFRQIFFLFKNHMRRMQKTIIKIGAKHFVC